MSTGQENTSSHRDGTDDYVAACGRQAWRNEQMCKVDPTRSPKTFRVLVRCSDEHLKELMHAWGTVDCWPLVKRLYPEYAK